MRNTRSAPKQKIHIATFFNKHTQSQNKRKRPVTLEEVIGDSADEDSDDNNMPERTQQQPLSCATNREPQESAEEKEEEKVG